MLGKRGISSVLTVALILLGTVIGVSLLWAFVVKSTDRSGEVVDPDCLTVNLELTDCKAYGSCSYVAGSRGYDANIFINRKVGSGNLTGLRFIFEDQYGIKKTYDRELNPPILNELESFRFQDGYSIPVAGDPHIVKVVALIGEKKDVCPISSVSQRCEIITTPPPLGNNPPRPQCCMWPRDSSLCYDGNDPNYLINSNGQLTNGIMPPGNRTLCCFIEPS